MCQVQLRVTLDLCNPNSLAPKNSSRSNIWAVHNKTSCAACKKREAESKQTKLQRNLCNFICLHSASFGNFQRNVAGTVAVWHLQFLHWRSCSLHGIVFSESISHVSLLGPWNYPIPWNCWNSMPSGSFRYFATFDFATFRIRQTDWHRRSGGLLCCFLGIFPRGLLWGYQNYQRQKTSMISSWLAVWEAESRQTKLQRNLCNFICLHFCFLRQFPAQCCGHRGSVAPPVSPLAILQPPWHRLQWVNLPCVTAWSLKLSNSLELLKLHAFRILQILQPLLISPLFEFAKLTDTAEVVACCAAFLSSSLEASSEDIKINYQRQEDINDLFLAGRLRSRIETDEAAAEPLQLYLSPFCFLRQFPAQCCGHRGSVAPPVSPLAILQPPWHRLQWVNLPCVTAWSLKLSNSLELLKLHAFRILQILRHFWFRHFSNSPNWLTPQKWWPAVLLSCHLPSRPPLRISKLSKAGRHQWSLPGWPSEQQSPHSRNIHGVRWHQALLTMDFVRKWLKFSEPTWIHESMWFVQGQELEGSLDFAASWDSTLWPTRNLMF